jgi:hypothetical protein
LQRQLWEPRGVQSDRPVHLLQLTPDPGPGHGQRAEASLC